MPRTHLSKKEATALGLKIYFSYSKCKFGHEEFRYTNCGTCVECARENAKNRGDANREELDKYRHEYYLKNSEKIKERSRCWKDNNPEKYRKKNGLPEPTRPYPEDNRCELCENVETQKAYGAVRKLCLDHCHSTMAFRGWICAACNLMLGNSRNDVTILEKGIKYMKKFENANGIKK